MAEKTKTRDVFSPQEIQRLFAIESADEVWSHEVKSYLACVLAANTAMRAGEILGLQVGSLHLGGDLPWVAVEASWDRKELKGTKRGVNRKVPIPEWLGRRLIAITPAAGFVCTDDAGKTPIPYFRLRKTLQKALVSIGISLEDQRARGLGGRPNRCSGIEAISNSEI